MRGVDTLRQLHGDQSVNHKHSKIVAQGREGENSYFLCLPDEKPRPIDLTNYHRTRDDVYIEYFVEAFRRMETEIGPQGFTFYIVWNSPFVRALPSYGEHVIALLLLDEQYRLPSYHGRVRLILRPYGSRPVLGRRVSLSMGSFWEFIKYVRNYANWAPAWSRYRIRMLLPSTHSLVHRQAIEIVPLGYANHTALPLKPFEKRGYFACFAGSMVNPGATLLKQIFSGPKEISRRRMLAAVTRFQKAHPEVPIFVKTFDTYVESFRSDPSAYSCLLNDAKITLVPHGSVPETHRFHEALCFGSVPICEQLPNQHYFSEKPRNSDLRLA